MNRIKYLSAILALIMLPMAAMAQKHIENAFAEFLLKTKGISYSETRSKNTDPVTKKTKGMLIIYTFKIENWKPSMLDNIREAVRLDSDAAYQENWATGDTDEEMKERNLLFSDDEGIEIGVDYPNYIQLSFADEKQEGYRYAYAVEWNDATGKGRLIKTYAPRPAKNKRNRQFFILPKSSDDFKSWADSVAVDTAAMADAFRLMAQEMVPFVFKTTKTSSSWITEFIQYKKAFMSASKNNVMGSVAYATKIYELCKECSMLNDAERKMIVKEIEKLKKLTKDDLVNCLFDEAIKNLMREEP